MKKIILLSFITAILFASNAQCQMDFDFDYARFKYDSASSYLEIYYVFDQSSLTRQEKDGTSFVSALLKVAIYDTSLNTSIVNNQWRINNEIKDTLSKSLVGTLNFVVPKGNYNIHVEAKDGVDSTISKTIKDKIYIDPYSDIKKAYISDIQLASNIIKDFADKNSIFYKNTLEIIPHPNPVYGKNNPIVFYYCELYNMNKLSDSAQLNITVHSNQGQQLYSKNKNIAKTSNAIVEIGTINISKYPTDSYFLKIAIRDSSNEISTSLKKIYIYNPDIEANKTPVQDNSVLGSEYAVLSEEECDDLFEKSKFILQSWQIKDYKNISDLDSKRKFLFELWKKLDSNPNTPENEFKNEYMQRIKESNERFSSLGRKGMKTDRGRIHILYGQPDQIDRFPNSTEMKPYEIWVYNSIEGGVYFVFGDVTGFGNYELLHSTKRGEVQYDNWEDRLIVN